MIKNLLILILVICISLMPVSAFKQITGFTQTSSNEYRSYAGLELDRVSVYTLSLDIPAGMKLASIKMSGEVIGSGRANAFIEDNSGAWFVALAYNNNRNALSKSITGMFDEMGKTLAGDEIPRLFFEDKCVETCYLETSFASGEVGLVFDVEEGTVLKIDDISYNFELSSEESSKIGKLFLMFLNLFR